MSQTPAISVVLPVFNAEAFVRDAVKSILAQTFGDFELIIINDGSTDGSGSILKELAASDSRIVLVERANAGLVPTLNEGIELARADLIARMDADDVAMPERFALQLTRMTAEPKLGVLGSFIRIVDKTGQFIRQGDYPVTPTQNARFLLHGSPLAHPSVMMRKVAVKKVGGYRRVFSHCEDYDLWLRISEIGFWIANLPKPLLDYRVHGSNVSTLHREAQELGTIVCLLSHRCRKAGLPDPVEGKEKIELELIQLVPAHLRKDLDAAIFVFRYTQISLADRYAVKNAWQEYKKLPQTAKREPVTCGFLMRLLNGAVRNYKYALAINIFYESFMQNPVCTVNLLALKLKTRIFL